jgi:hypothetical protein
MYAAANVGWITLKATVFAHSLRQGIQADEEVSS